MATPTRKTGRAEQETSGLFASAGKRNVVLGLLLAVGTLVLYNPVNQHPFVNYDDDRYVTENPHIRAGFSWETIRWAFSSTEQANWHPLTWLSHALDYQMFHLNAGGHHLTSLLIHAVNAVLLFLLLAYGTGRAGPSLLVAALFAFHPINVESVAWVAERKNVLCTFFFFLTIGAYGWYARKPDWKRYLPVALLFACGLMAKPMGITLPFVLLLLDYWPLGRAKGSLSSTRSRPQMSGAKLVWEKIPLMALSAASAVITMKAQEAGGAIRSTTQFSLGVRLENALAAYGMYLWKAVWPSRLAPLYPHPGDSLAAWQVAASALLLGVVSALAWRFRSKPYLLSGWLWFLGTLVPVIGLVQVGDQAMADRYAYIPLIGIFVIIAWTAADLAEARRIPLTARAVPVACVLIALAAVAYRQIGYWGSSYDLWSHTLAVTEKNFIAEDNLGGTFLMQGKPDEAFAHFQAAAQIHPQDPMSHANVGAYLQEHGRLQEAVEQYDATIRLTSDRGLLASAYANQGTAYRELGDFAKARESYDHALRQNPNQFNAYLGLGRLLEQEGKLEEAIINYSRSVELRPTDEGFMYLGHALEKTNRLPEAMAAYRQALKISPDSGEAQQAADALAAKMR
jgi:tetratricopeptide (TPR) repeat protein